MESLPYGLVLKKKKNKKNNNNEENEIKDNNNEGKNTNEIIIEGKSLLIKSEMDKCGFYPKTNYFINNNNELNEDDKFPEKFNFEKIFPNLTSYFKNLDNNFSLAFENINNNSKHKKNELHIKNRELVYLILHKKVFRLSIPRLMVLMIQLKPK